MTSPASSLARFARTVAPLLLLLVAGCPGDEDTPAGATGGAPAAIEAAPPPPTGPAGVTEVRSTKDPLPDEVLAAVPATLRPIDLAPVVRPLGPDDAIATGFVVELARAFAAPSQVGGPALDGTTLTIEPAVDGVLRVSTPTTLTFVPSSPLLPDTEYTVTLESVGTPHAVLRPGTPGQWSHTLRTPGFRVLRAGWSQVRFDENRAAIDVVFAGPVDVAAARERLTMTIDGARNPQPRVETTNDPAVLRLPLSGPAVKAGTRVGLSLAGGVPMQGLPGATAPAFKRAMTVPSVPAVNVLAIRRGEGPTGFFVDVICRDEAAPEGWNGWWDEVHGDWYELTSRCLPPDEGGAAGIRFSPPVPDVRVSPTRQGFRILGDFARGAYTVTLDSFTSKDGGVLPDPRSDAFTIPARAPQVQFVSKGRYLPSTAWKALPVRHLNLSQVQLEVRHVPERNLVHWLTGDVEAADARTSDLLVSAAVPVQGPTDDFGTTWLDLGAHVPTRTNGVYEVRVAGGAASDTSRVLVTSLHLVAKQAAVAPDAPYTTGLDVWAVHADTLKPVPGTAVDVRRRSGTVLGSCTTAAGGHCRVTLTPDPVDPEPPYVVLARHGEDLTYLRFEDLQTPLTEAAVDGEPYLAPEAYRVAMYSDRGVYRPGETAHLVGVVRGTDRRAPQKGMPLMMSLVDPRGRVLGRHTLSTDAAGVIAYDPEFGDWAVTGRYTAKVAAGDDELATYSFYVEEFVPERMEVSASLGEPDLLAGEAAFARIEARYLFGGSAEGSPAEVDCELVPATFAPTRNGQFTYGPWRGDDADGQRGLSLGSAAGELDKQGALSVACPELSAGTSWEGTGTLVARAVVFEAGSGRSTQSKATATVHPERFHIGLQTGTEEAHGGEPIAVSGVVVDWQGARTSGRQEVLLTAYRLEDEYGWWYDEDDGYGSYRRSLRRVEEGRGTVTAEGGAFAWTFTPSKDAAGFLIEARAGNAHTGMKVEGTSSYWWWSDPDGSADATPKPLKPGTLELTLPDSIKQGSKATATFTAPYAGRALLSVETADVRTWEWLDVKPGPTSWTFSVDQWAPNVYVSALLLKDPHSDSAETYMADRAFGVGSVRIDAAAYTQELVIRAPEEVRPNSELVVELELPGAGPDTVVTVAAIDEGILQLTGFETPDPLAQLLAKRALGVQSFETVGWSILVPPEGATSSTGGDAPDGDLGRAQPVEPVALWSGVVPVTKGKATVRLDVPQYRGKLRVMAVSAGPERVGHADGSVLVRDPLVVQATLPRFLMEGDRVDVPVFVTNMSKEPQDVVVSLGATDVGPALAGAPGGPPVDVLGGAERRMKLGIGASDTAVFEVVARRQVGTVQFEVQAKAGKLLSRAKQVVPFAPDAPRARVLHRVELTAGANDLSDWMAGWVPTTERTVLRVTSNPYGDVFDHLGYLVQYPYGCIEQTTSSTRPMLFVDRLLQQVDPEIAADHGISKRVNHGIRRVLSMQTGSGGFAYWPGSDAPHAWATAYATHMLLDARERGYDVPDASLDQALRWMESQVDAGASDGWRYGLPYMHYVLARAGRGRKALASSLLARIDGASKDGADLENTYLLQAALWQAGDRRHEDALRHPDVSAVKDERRNGWSFYSDRRRRGLVLTLFGELFGNDPDGEALAAVVASALQGNSSRWYTTQELVWGVTGLGRRISAGAKDFAVPVLVAGGTTLEPRWTDRDTSERAWEVTRLSERGAPTLTVESKGEGVLYALVASEGVQQGAVWQEGAEGIRVSRRYLTQEGAPIDPTGLSLGDLVVVRVDLRNTTAEDMRNVALVDRLPAGFEIENANLGRDRVIDVVDTSLLWQRDHMNVRDDRVEVFGTLPKGGDVSFTYAVRATSAGDFVVPPVEAEAMYDPRFWGREVGDRVVIQGPWTGISDAE